MVAAQYDSWQLSHLVHGYDGLEEKPKPYTAAEQRYAEVGRAGRMAGRWWKSLDESCHGEHSNFDMGAQSTTFCKFWAFVISSAAILLGESEWTWWLTVD